MNAGQALQRAIYDRLSSDGVLKAQLAGQGIYDQPPPNARFPYVTFGRTNVFDWSTSTEKGDEVILSLHVWSSSRSRAEASEIVEQARTILEAPGLDPDGPNLVELRLQFSEVRYDEDAQLFRGLLRYHALLELEAA